MTQADRASQEAVRKIVLDAFPEHGFLGEEDPPEAINVPYDYRWIVDPLDGTTNFVHGVPHYAVSLALERQGEILVGVVYDPVHDDCFSAEKGHGARLNGEPIRVSEVEDISEALGVLGFPPHVTPDMPDYLVFEKALFRCQALRRTGSAALNLSYLAAGRYDLFWSFGTKIWDIAAGILLVEEAGGHVCSPDGTPFSLKKTPFLAAGTEKLLDALHKLSVEALAK